MLLCYSNDAASLELRQAGCKTFLQQLLFELIEHFDLTKLPFVDFCPGAPEELFKAAQQKLARLD
jgi:hypothetical protein